MPNENLTFNQIFEEYISDKKENWKISSYKRTCCYYEQIKNILGDQIINEITQEQLLNWRNQLIHSSYSTRTLQHDFYLLKALYNYNREYHNGLANKNIANLKPFSSDPNKIIDISEKYKYWNKEETLKFLNECDRLHTLNKRNNYYHGGYLSCKIIVSLCVFAGLRIGEATALQIKDLIYNKENNQYSLKITKTKGITSRIDDFNYLTAPKSKNSVRIVPIPDILKDILLEVKNRPNVSEEYFFSTGYKYTSSDFIKRIKVEVEKNLNLEHIRMHDLRHTYVYSLYKCGTPTYLVTKYLGHSDEKIVINEYLHFDENTKTEFISNLNAYYK